MKIVLTRENIELWIVKYLWLFILMPKMVQFVMYAGILALLVAKKKIGFNKTGVIFMAGGIVQIVAIVRQCILGSPGFSRIAAGLNTSLIWMIAAVYYSLMSEENLTPGFKSKFIQYVRMDAVIMFLIYLFSLVSSQNVYTIFGHQLYLKRLDYLSSGVTTRFCGFAETVIGPSHLLSFVMPVLLLDKPENDFKNVFVVFLGYMAVIATHSRMGIVCCGAMVLLVIRQLLSNKLGRSITRKLDILAAVFLVTLAIVYYQEIWTKFLGFFNSRSGSNSTRFRIYRESFRMALENSPILGIGIKYMLQDGIYSFPYGSHSTYIGLFYKTGILGSLMYLLGFTNVLQNILRNIKKERNFYTILAVFILYFGLLVFADIDGSDWVIVTVFAIWGLMSNGVLYEKKEECKSVDIYKHIGNRPGFSASDLPDHRIRDSHSEKNDLSFN